MRRDTSHPWRPPRVRVSCQDKEIPITTTTKPTTTMAIISTALQFREGNSDKVYHAAVEEKDGGHVVTFAYGRRGSTLTTGTKTQAPVSLAEATKIHDKLVASKVAKGYRPSGESAPPYHQTGEEARDSGIRCQLLNPVDECEVPRLLEDGRYCLQEKHDGRRLLVRRRGGEVTGINRRGLFVAVPGPVVRALRDLPHGVLIDGEAVGEVLHAFDLLEAEGRDLRERPYSLRFAGLLALLEPDHPALRPVVTVTTLNDKRVFFDTFRMCGSEGVVFKDLEAPFSPGRPNSGGSQLKFKFVQTASCIVDTHNGRRSVALALLDDGRRVRAGNVTIPANHDIPKCGDVVEIRYLYAFRESGSLYQPVYLGVRDDIPESECTVDQLKYKSATSDEEMGEAA